MADADERECPRCRGYGRVPTDDPSVWVSCPVCGGSGKVPDAG